MEKYTEDNIRSLDWREHIRIRPGMYIGKLGDGSSPEDGIYILIKEVIDNSIDEYVMGNGSKIEVEIDQNRVKIRDYGRGIPLGKVIECVSKINTGGKYDSKAFKKSVGLNGVGTKAVNALSDFFKVSSFRDGQEKAAVFEKGILLEDIPLVKSSQPNGTEVIFKPDGEIFKQFKFRNDFLEQQLWNYAYLNAGLKIYFNGQLFFSKNGLLDLLDKRANAEHIQYPLLSCEQ